MCDSAKPGGANAALWLWTGFHFIPVALLPVSEIILKGLDS